MIKFHVTSRAAIRLLIALTLVFSLLLNTTSPARASTVIDISGPLGSGAFGAVTLLPNGNFVVVDTSYDAGATLDVGAVYLYNGATGAQISALTGTSADDQVGSGGVVVLTNGNYLVFSPNWDNGSVAGAGAVTWGSKTTGVNGVLGAANSLVGSNADDQVGYDNGSTGYLELPNGHYVITSPGWDNGAATNAGAVTWGSGTSGVKGSVSAANSLVGSTTNDLVGQSGQYSGVASLSNGNYVVNSPAWDRTDTNPDVLNAGAVTWGNGTVGVKGTIGPGNSLVGSNDNDAVGSGAITGSIQELADGNYVVLSPAWDSYRGAASLSGVGF